MTNSNKYILYFDVSAINWMADDGACDFIAEQLCENTHSWISAYTAAELVANADPVRRRRLCQLATRLQMPYTPLTSSDQMLARSIRALIAKEDTVEYSLAHDSTDIWHFVASPDEITDEVRQDVMRRKTEMEQRFADFMYGGRDPMQAGLGAARARGEGPADGRPSEILRAYVRDGRSVREAVRKIAEQIPGVDVTDDLVSRVIDDLEPWRFFLAAWGYGIYARAIQQNNYGNRRNPGRFDTEQAVYLTNCHVFVTCDHEQRRMIRTVNPFGKFRRLVWHYRDVARWVETGCPPIAHLDRLPGPTLVP